VARRHGRNTTLLDLERPRDVDALAEPMLALEARKGLVVIDEVQRRPDLFPVLRVLADRRPLPARFLVLGSASPHLLRQTSESLAGRITFYELTGFALDEAGAPAIDRLWLRGGFPRSYLAATDAASLRWRIDFVRTFLERDIAELGISLAPAVVRRFWAMVARSHGNTWNASGIARSLGVTDATARRYLDLLAGMFVVRVLPAWHENIAKRQVKAPKVYVADSGLLHALLDIESPDTLDLSPHAGASWEGFALSQVVERLGCRPEQCFFWRTHAGAELDLLVVKGTKRFGFEFKRTETPGAATPSMHIAAEDLHLDRLDVVHPGPDTYALKGGFRALSLRRLLSDLRPL
jgi:predicted AAA+ superfamily ATPase